MEKDNLYFYRIPKSGIEFIYSQDSSLSYPEHNHISIYTIGLILSGVVTLKVHNQSVVCGAGESFVICPYIPHSLIADGRYGMVSLCIKAPLIGSHSLQELKDIIEKKAALLYAQNCLTPKHLSILLSSLEQIYSDNQSYLSIEDKYVELMKQSIEQYPENTFSLEQKSKETYISKYHLIRVFKKTVGLTPHKFQVQNRIRKAQHLLNENMSVTEAALAVGFYDQSHFIRNFKRIVGIAPSDFKAASVRLTDN